MGKFSDQLGKKKQLAQGKISVRLLEYAQPMIDQARERDGEPEPHELEGLLKMAVMLWNAKVIEQLGQGSNYVEEIERAMSADPVLPSLVKNMTKQMLARKIEMFPNDLRFIGDFEIFKNADGEFRIRAEARMAKELLDEH